MNKAEQPKWKIILRSFFYKMLFVFASILTIFSCTVSSDNFPNQYNLKLAICKSIKVPFHYGDTIIYESHIGICGNSGSDYINRYYEPHLNEQPFLDTLKSTYNGVILCTDDSLNALMNRLCKNKSDSLTVWDCFFKNKIDLQVTGEAITNKSVRIYETYGYKKEYKQITKIFTYENNEWTSKIDTTNARDYF